MRISFDELREGQTIIQFWSGSLVIYFIGEKTDDQVKIRSMMVDIHANRTFSWSDGSASKETWDETINANPNLYWCDETRRHQAIWAIFEERWT